jgi:hypothetical protein
MFAGLGRLAHLHFRGNTPQRQSGRNVMKEGCRDAYGEGHNLFNCVVDISQRVKVNLSVPKVNGE